MNQESALVSIIIPTYSRPTNLIRAIESVLNQTYENIEIIVVDDNGVGSQFQKETYSLLKPYIEQNKIQYYAHDKNINGSAARNTGFSHSNGTYICYLDDDDVFSTEKIVNQVETLEKNKAFAATYCDTEKVRVKGPSNTIVNPNEVCDVGIILSGRCFFNTSTVMFRRGIITELNGFDERFYRHQDYELYLRFFRNHKMTKTSNAKVLKFETPNIISQNPHKAEEYLNFFLNEFRKDIDLMPLKSEIIFFQFNWILILYIRNKEYGKAFSIYKYLKKYKKPGFYEYLKYLYHFLYSLWHH